jgi:hypothetical protein
VHGPAAVSYDADELVTITVVRNGEPYAAQFVEHYTRLGVRHMVFLDNGSTDRTREILSGFPNTTVLATRVSYVKYENAMKLYLARRFSTGRWNLCVDVDEFFDYPFSSVVPLRRFLQYLDERRFTAVVCQMLDMFADAPLADLTRGDDATLARTCGFYDLSAIERSDYDWSDGSGGPIKMHWGGIRRAVFGTNNGLTKAALVRMDAGVQPFHTWHHATGARLADVSCVLLHYPFTSSFVEKVRDAVRTGRYGATTTDEYAGYFRAIEAQPRLSLRRAEARRYEGVDQLLGEGFLVASERYRRWASGAARERPAGLRR